MFKKALAYSGMIACLFVFTGKVDAQAYVVHAVVESGDTIPLIYLGEAEIEGRWKPRDRREAERYDKLMRNVIKV